MNKKLKINISEVNVNKSVAVDYLSTIKKSWVGQFYIVNLKRYSIARWIFINTWHLFLRIYLIIDKNWIGKAKHWRKIVKFSSYVDGDAIFNKVVFAGVELKIAEPQVLPASDTSLLASVENVCILPSVRVAEMDGVV
jgi:hypothetical protein